MRRRVRHHLHHLRQQIHRLRHSQVWTSVFRTGIPSTPRSRHAVMLSNVFLHLHPTRISAASIRVIRTWCAGGLSLLLFIVLLVTGAFLMVYYRPTTALAYRDLEELQFVVPYGRLLRNLHRWTAHGMVILVIVHMARVFYAGAYRPPREFNWVIGVWLLVMTLFLSFTGYLLPWDQLAFWAVTVGTNMAGAVPLAGGDIKLLLIGGDAVGENTLVRFYVLHCVLVPLAMIVLMSIHFYRVRRDGGVLARY